MFAKINKGFTLAEVLITLVVIGVIAGLTIPALVQQVQKDQYVAGLKKAYSEITQAYNLLKLEGGGDITYVFSSNDAGDAASDRAALNYFANKLNIVKNCGSTMGCWYNIPRYYLNGGIHTTTLDTIWNNDYGKAILADGTMIYINDLAGNCINSGDAYGGEGPLTSATCGPITIDINGTKKPNTFGRDIFSFHVTKTGIYPYGTYNDGFSCNSTSGEWQENIGCTTKVLKEGAMNY